MTEKLSIPEFFGKARPLTAKTVALKRQYLVENAHEVTVFLCRTKFNFWCNMAKRERIMFREEWVDLIKREQFLQVLARYGKNAVRACKSGLADEWKVDILLVLQQITTLLAKKGFVQQIYTLNNANAYEHAALWREGCTSMLDHRTTFSMPDVRTHYSDKYAEMVVYGAVEYAARGAPLAAYAKRHELCFPKTRT